MFKTLFSIFISLLINFKQIWGDFVIIKSKCLEVDFRLDQSSYGNRISFFVNGFKEDSNGEYIADLSDLNVAPFINDEPVFINTESNCGWYSNLFQNWILGPCEDVDQEVSYGNYIRASNATNCPYDLDCRNTHWKSFGANGLSCK